MKIILKSAITVVLAFWVSTTFSNVNHNLTHLIKKYDKLLNNESLKDSLFYANPDSAKLFLTLLAKEAFIYDSLNYALNAQLEKIYYFNNISKLDSTYVNLKVIEKWIFEKKSRFVKIEYWKDYNNSINDNWANYYYKIGNHNKATSLYKKTNSEIYRNYPFSDHDYYLLRKNHLFLGKMAYLNGNYDEALSYYDAGIKFTDTAKLKYNVSYPKTSINNLVAQVYSAKKEYEKSIKIFEQTLSQRLEKKPTVIIINGIINNHYSIARNYIALDDYDKADSLLKLSKTFHRNEEPYLIEYLVLHASVFKKMGKYNQAQALLNEAETNQINKNQQFSYKSFLIYIEKANINQQQKQYPKALKAYKQAEACLFKEKIDTSIFSMATLSNVFYKKEFAELLSARANCLQNWYKETDSLFYLQQSKANIDLALVTLESLRQEYASADARQFLIENSYPVFEKAIAINKQLWELTNETKFFEVAFQAAERSKSLSLSDALKKEYALKATGISDEDLNKEKQHQFKIYQLKKEIAQLEGDSISIEQKKSELFNLNESYKKFNAQLEIEYPLYHQLKYQPNLTTVNEVQNQLLNPSAALVEYFLGDGNLYVFYIDKNKVKLVADSAVHQIKESGKNFINSIDRIMNGEKDNIEYKATYVAEASYLKNRLLKTGLIKASINRLTIIPDGQIAYIPFEALLTKTIHKQQIPPWGQLPYLIRQFTVNYLYAASLQKTGANTISKSEELPIDFLGIAPSFEYSDESEFAFRSCSDKPLKKLNHNQTEVIFVQDNIGGSVLLDSAATKTNFIEYAPKSEVIHIASHACAGSTEEDNRIYLYDDEYINMYDLYALKLKAKMLVLSACETSVGTLKKGEGMMSLARSFFFTSVQSLTTSLWSVDDKATSTIMQLYYKYLKTGIRKDEALRQAKLAYFETTDYQTQNSPGYWAGFVHFGDAEPIYKEQKKNNKMKNNILLGLLLLLLLFVLIIMFYKLK